MLKKVRFYSEDSENFRKYYKTVEGNLLYCTMPPTMMTLPQWKNAGKPLDWFVCSKDGEPCAESKHTFEIVK